MALILQSFGNEKEYKRAVFTVLSYYAYHPHLSQQTLLFTDNPGHFKNYLEGTPVQFEILTPHRMKEMQGEINFLHRMKIAIIDHAFRTTGEEILYTDSDTFFTGNTDHLMSGLSANVSYMHLREHTFESLLSMALPAGQPFHAFAKAISSGPLMGADGSVVKTSLQQYSWNAGVMMLHRSVAELLPDVYALTDQLYPQTQNHACEQYAFSIVIQNNTEMRPCDEVVYHYWYRIKKEIADIFLSQHLTEEWQKKDIDQKLSDIRKWTKVLPSLFENHILMLRDHAIQEFNMNNFKAGYRWSLKALLKNPFNKQFIRDFLYHTRRHLLKTII